MKTILSILIGTLFTSVSSWGQNTDIIKEFKALSNHYAQLKSYSMDVSVQYVDADGNKLMTQQGSVVHLEDAHFVKMGANTTLITEDFFISVNEAQRTLVYNENQGQKKKKSKKRQASTDITAQLDSLWKLQETLNYKIIQSPKGTLRVFLEDDESPYYSAYEITIDTKRHNLLEMVYYYKSTNEDQAVSQVRILYSNQNDRPSSNQNRLKAKNYVTKKNGEYMPSEMYKHYLFIDQTKHQ